MGVRSGLIPVQMEDQLFLGRFAPVLAERGYAVRHTEAGYDDLAVVATLIEWLRVLGQAGLRRVFAT